MRHTKYLEAAMAQAKIAEKKLEVPVGAIIVRDDKIIARAHNLRETRQSPIAHAEILAIEKASKKLGSWRLEHCDVYVTLEPCPMCMSALQQARVRHVYYGAADPKGGALSLGYDLHSNLKLNHRFRAELVTSPACSHILTNFFKERRKKKQG